MKNKRYTSAAHSKTRIMYHIILCVKYRKKLLEAIKDSVFEWTKSTEKGDYIIKEQEIDKDHIHLLVHAKPTIAPFEIIHRLKQQTTYMAYKTYYDYMKQHFWTREHKLWSRGYFLSTIGEVSEEGIRYYIQNQG